MPTIQPTPYSYKYFHYREFEFSLTAQSKGITNSIPPKYFANLDKLVERVLDPAREKFGYPIKVNSGYRSPALNRAVDGAPKSLHLEARAADITPVPPSREGLRRLGVLDVKQWKKLQLSRLYNILETLPHTELIRYPTFIHVAL